MSKKRSLEGGGTNNTERYLATICLYREADFLLLFSDGPEVKKVASQSEIDSSLCMFEKPIAILL